MFQNNLEIFHENVDDVKNALSIRFQTQIRNQSARVSMIGLNVGSNNGSIKD